MQSVDRVAQTLKALSEAAPAGLTLSECARATSAAPATCHRLLRALEQHGLAERNEDTLRWRPGLGLVRLAATVSPIPGFGPRTEKMLAALRDEWQECFYLAVLADSEVVLLRSTEATLSHRASVSMPLGRRAPLHAAAAAKAILAQLSRSEATALLTRQPLERYTPHTICDVETLLEQFAVIRDRGYAVCDEETDVGVVAYAAPIYGPPGEPPRSLGVIGLRARIRDCTDRGLLHVLMSAAGELSVLPRSATSNIGPLTWARQLQPLPRG